MLRMLRRGALPAARNMGRLKLKLKLQETALACKHAQLLPFVEDDLGAQEVSTLKQDKSLPTHLA